MGKHERSVVEQAEKIIVKLINKQNLSPSERRHPLIRLSKKFAKYLSNKYSIARAEHVGNKYDSLGDIKLILGSGLVKYIELKFLDKGLGTLANISQNALTELGIFNCEPWSKFREQKKHYKTIIKFLNEFTYPQGLIPDRAPKRVVYERAEYLKKVVGVSEGNVEGICRRILRSPDKYSPERVKAAKIILKIIKFDRKVKLEYINLLSKVPYDKDKLKLFSIALIKGAHTMRDLREEMSKRLASVVANVDSYEIYYLYKKSLRIEKAGKLQSLLKSIAASDIGICFKPNQTNLVVCIVNQARKKRLLRIVFHWKNKFQGIQTPCLNIFLEVDPH